MKNCHLIYPRLLMFMVIMQILSVRSVQIDYREDDKARLEAVREFADNVLIKGADHWSGRNTPLLADGINVKTGQPVVWRYQGEEYVIHNLASQQNLFRVLTGLTNITGEKKYQEAAQNAIEYHFDNLVSGCGKLRWGGHQFIDLKTLEPVGRFDADCHEFKRNFPFYELMWEVDQDRTAAFIRALWQGHILNWRNLTMNRHAAYGGGPAPTAGIWDTRFDDPEPFFHASALSFLNCGADLIYAGGLLYHLSGEEGALRWALRLAGMYTKARHPETGMGAYQYTKPERRRKPPEDGPLTERLTWSTYGDRAENQFGRSGSSDPEDEFYNPIRNRKADDGMLIAREGWMVGRGGYPWYALVQLHLAEVLGEAGKAFADDAADHLEAYAGYSYDPEKNHFLAMWANGTDVTGLKVPRTGYYGSKGRIFNPRRADADDLISYIRAFRLTGRAGLWTTARSIAQGIGIGEIGSKPGQDVDLNSGFSGSSASALFAVLEMHRTAPHPQYLQLARRIGDRMIANQFHHGFFLASSSHLNARFDTVSPLALLSLDAALRGMPEKVPGQVGGRGFIHGQYDGYGRTYDSRAIWNQRR